VVDQWFNASMEGALPGMLLDPSSLMFDLLDPDAVRRLLNDHRSGRQDNHKVLFSLVMVEQWLRELRPTQREPAHAR
jgi:asparagine synthase (glutamine-hydrolysing)